MPRTYERKTTRGFIPEAVFDQAYAEVISNKRTKRNAAIHYNILLSTFDRFVAKKLKGHSSFGYVANNKIFTTTEERQLITYKKKSADRHWELSRKDVRSFAFDYAKTKERKVPIEWKNQSLAT